jgi:hypothetical protein
MQSSRVAVRDSRTRCSHRVSRNASRQQKEGHHAASRVAGIETAEQNAFIACRGMPAEKRTRCSHRVSRDAQRVKNKLQSSRVAGERRKNKTKSSRVAEETKRSHRESRKRQAAVIACRGMSAEGRTRRSHRVSRVRGSRTSCSQRVSRDRGKKNKLQSSRVAGRDSRTSCSHRVARDASRHQQTAVFACRGLQADSRTR